MRTGEKIQIGEQLGWRASLSGPGGTAQPGPAELQLLFGKGGEWTADFVSCSAGLSSPAARKKPQGWKAPRYDSIRLAGDQPEGFFSAGVVGVGEAGAGVVAGTGVAGGGGGGFVRSSQMKSSPLVPPISSRSFAQRARHFARSGASNGRSAEPGNTR